MQGWGDPFTDDYPAEYTHVGFHGHYDAHGHLNADLVRQYGLGQWIMQYSDGKADPQLVERWIHIPSGRGMIHFFHPGLLQRGGVSTFLCQGDESTGLVFACEPIWRTALELGIVTSLEIVQSTDQAALRAALPARPPASGFAAIDDDSGVPVSVARGSSALNRGAVKLQRKRGSRHTSRGNVSTHSQEKCHGPHAARR
jgi:hypothetical protein